MKTKLLLLTGLVVCCTFIQLSAQCGTCIPDPSCATSNPNGGICPAIMPDATQGEAYSEEITFYMPVTFVDAGTGFTIDLLNIEVVDVQGLPFDLEWECNSVDCTYQPPSNPPASELGCITICGTPIAAPGTYDIVVNIVADVYVQDLMIPLTQPETYETTLTVLPGSGGNNSFSFSPIFGCETLDVDFEALIDFNPNQPTEWAWDFGNGSFSTDKAPIATYSAPGVYPVSLGTTVYNYVLTEVCVSSLNQAWCGDVEEATCTTCGVPVVGQCPDPFVEIYDADSNLMFASEASDESTSACWGGLSIVLDNPPYTMIVWDEDVLSMNDNLGTFSFNFNATGSQSFSGANGTAGTVEIGTAVDQTFNDVDSIYIYENPEVPLVTESGGTLSVDNPNAYDVQWYQDGNLISGETGNMYTPTMGGNYTATFTEVYAYGSCSETSTGLNVGLQSATSAVRIAGLFPNPTSGLLNLDLELDASQDVLLSVVDKLGRQVYQENLANMPVGASQAQVDLTKLATGFYFIQLELEDKSRWTEKLFIE